ncbi:MAG: thioesterase [Desulfobulbus propionicus]|nr:MAG: thioesterase [Desulfobulbus propionicus]
MNKKYSTALGNKVHETVYRVIYGDTDAAGVMYNANYLRLFEIGRTEFMRDWGIPYKSIEEMGFVLPVTESYLRFKSPACYDDLLVIASSLIEMSDKTCRFHHMISKREKDKYQLVARGFTKLACVNKEGKLRSFPEKIVQAVSGLI